MADPGAGASGGAAEDWVAVVFEGPAVEVGLSISR